MSECVVRMPYPKDCESCHLKTRNFFTGDFICAKTHTFLPASGKNNNCPIICVLPKGHGDLIDRNKLLGDIEMYHVSDGCFQHWAESQDAVIPAEAERNVRFDK